MKIGLVGYQGCGKTTLFDWLIGRAPDPSRGGVQSAMASIPEPRLISLANLYHAKKIVYALMEIVDIPGLARDSVGNAARLGHLREADFLVCVVPTFDGRDVQKEMDGFLQEMIFADMEIAENRITRIGEQKKKHLPREEQEKLSIELGAIEKIKAGLESGNLVSVDDLTEDEYKLTRSFRFLTEKHRMILVNTADDETDFAQYEKFSTPEVPVIAVSVGLESELAKMSPQERQQFLDEMGLVSTDRDGIIRKLLDLSGQMVFLTAGEKEVRSWLMTKNGTAVEAAGCIHSDFAKNFIRVEVMSCDDLLRLGSEREVKAAGLNHRESKDYIIQDGDIIEVLAGK
ncbi:MAG: DUF933 domain-containing protein [Thermoguttaceae bacterium]|nr:DUF933 domain-containing protein [Thermoguttaceae bacterium]